MTNYHLTQVSRNSKLGAIPATTSGRQTCAKACPLFENGCYAEAGHVGMHWHKVTQGKRGGNWSQFINEIRRKIYPTQIWRHNVSGDLAGDGVTIDAPKLAELTKANKSARGFTYTHYDTIENAANREAVKKANSGGFTVNLSANNLDHADELAGLDIAPVASILPAEYERKNKRGAFTESLVDYKARLKTLPQTTPQGRRVTVCPATYIEAVSCATCKLCAVGNRKAIIGFPVHGASAKKAEQVANQ